MENAAAARQPAQQILRDSSMRVSKSDAELCVSASKKQLSARKQQKGWGLSSTPVVQQIASSAFQVQT